MTFLEERRRRPAKRPAAAPSRAPTIADLYTVTDFQAANAHLWASAESLRWFLRLHRPKLVQAGAVVELAGRVLVHGPRFIDAALQIGAEMAARQLEGPGGPG